MLLQLILGNYSSIYVWFWTKRTQCAFMFCRSLNTPFSITNYRYLRGSFNFNCLKIGIRLICLFILFFFNVDCLSHSCRNTPSYSFPVSGMSCITQALGCLSSFKRRLLRKSNAHSIWQEPFNRWGFRNVTFLSCIMSLILADITEE